MLVLWAVVGFMTLCLLIYLMVKDGRKDEESWYQGFVVHFNGKKHVLIYPKINGQKFIFSLPENWKVSDRSYISSSNYDFAIENSQGTAHIICILEKKREVLTFNEFKDLTEEAMQEDQKKNIYFEQIKRNKEKLWKADFSTTYEGLDYHVLYYVKETKNQYVQLIGWTLNSHFDDSKQQLETIMNSFSEVIPLSLKNTEKEQ
ncbi:hypothetical protein [Enterococcus sp. AZ007]|uniref:hypothetical protein n=1 Tax=Enterococcus sp. AZ007 TaxID=2774839 RepID=UPI003F239D04